MRKKISLCSRKKKLSRLSSIPFLHLTSAAGFRSSPAFHAAQIPSLRSPLPDRLPLPNPNPPPPDVNPIAGSGTRDAPPTTPPCAASPDHGCRATTTMTTWPSSCASSLLLLCCQWNRVVGGAQWFSLGHNTRGGSCGGSSRNDDINTGLWCSVGDGDDEDKFVLMLVDYLAAVDPTTIWRSQSLARKRSNGGNEMHCRRRATLLPFLTFLNVKKSILGCYICMY